MRYCSGNSDDGTTVQKTLICGGYGGRMIYGWMIVTCSAA